MGYYINPTESTLEDYILKNSIRMSKEDFANYKYTGKSQPYLPVCVVHNGDFMAAGVAVDAAERNRFIHPDDYRPKRASPRAWHRPFSYGARRSRRESRSWQRDREILLSQC